MTSAEILEAWTWGFGAVFGFWCMGLPIGWAVNLVKKV